jgi:hypothetical protein
MTRTFRIILMVSVLAAGCANADTAKPSRPKATAAAVSASNAPSVVVSTPSVRLPAAEQPHKVKNSPDVLIKTEHFSLGGPPIDVFHLTINTSRVSVRVVDMFGGIHPGGYRSYTLNELIGTLQPVIAVSGPGARSLSAPSALGLVIDNGKTVSALDPASGFATGFLCISSSGATSIKHAASKRVDGCRQAVQSGPIVVEPKGMIGIRPTEREKPALARLIAAADEAGRLHIYAFSAAHLYDVAEYLRRSKMVSALNIASGLQNAGLSVRDGASSVKYGNLEGAVPTALVVERI